MSQRQDGAQRKDDKVESVFGDQHGECGLSDSGAQFNRPGELSGKL
jgi:hypothetical protein